MSPPLRLFVFLAAPLAGFSAAQASEPSPDFNRDVLPILSENCFACHGPDANARQAELRLDQRESAVEAAVVPGDSGASELVRRVLSDDPDQLMPPPASNRALSDDQKQTLRLWVDAGAQYSAHWAFVPPARPPVPAPPAGATVHNPIDAFAAARLVQENLPQAPAAAPEKLLRRATLDLTGIPPTLEELDAFLADPSPQAYEKAIDRLLASPRYGERMVWEWLDAARYADTNGYQGDPTRPMWYWRDWAIGAFNDNLPYDRFTVEQLAGDLLDSPTQSQQIATGFHRNHMLNGEGGRIAEESRVEYVQDRVETTGAVWMGLTLTCCRCHDHKYDPFSQKEYYQLSAYFNSVDESGATDAGGMAHPLLTLSDSQKEARVAELAAAEQQAAEGEAKDAARKAREQAEAELPKTMVMRDRAQPRETFVLLRGSYVMPGEQVRHGVPASLPPLPPDAAANRLALARWLVAPEHPLTARVAVNRLWQQFFGTGLVKSVEDFGVQGDKPSHPELLDWLAVEFRESGWNVKHVVRLIVTSATYRQASHVSAELVQRDPENRLLARGPRLRLPSWMLRDQALAFAGLLVEKSGGPPVKGYQPEGIWEDATFGQIGYEQDHGESLYRRSLYTFWRRIVAPTLFFDVANRQNCSVRAGRTNTPLHALVTLNDVTYVEAARALAQRSLLFPLADDSARLTEMFRRCTARTTSPREVELLLARLAALRQTYAAEADAAVKLISIGESKADAALAPAELAAWTGVAALILNLDETLTKE